MPEPRHKPRDDMVPARIPRQGIVGVGVPLHLFHEVAVLNLIRAKPLKGVIGGTTEIVLILLHSPCRLLLTDLREPP